MTQIIIQFAKYFERSLQKGWGGSNKVMYSYFQWKLESC